MRYTIFSIDNHTDIHSMSKFLHFLDTLMAMGKAKGKFIQCVGSWGGKLEPSFLCRTDDFDKHVRGSYYIENPECVMQVSECNKQYAQLLYPDGTTSFLGSLKSVGKDVAMGECGWTYRPDLNCYWVVVKGNPDTVHTGN